MATVSVMLLGCAPKSPQVKVLGISQGQERVSSAAPQKHLVVFLEVVNPTARDLKLSALEYQLAADSWFATKGKVSLSRAVGADSTAIVQIPVPFKAANAGAGQIPYQFEGRLFTVEERVERSWPVKVRGVINPHAVATRARVFGQVATAD